MNGFRPKAWKPDFDLPDPLGGVRVIGKTTYIDFGGIVSTPRPRPLIVMPEVTVWGRPPKNQRPWEKPWTPKPPGQREIELSRRIAERQAMDRARREADEKRRREREAQEERDRRAKRERERILETVTRERINQIERERQNRESRLRHIQRDQEKLLDWSKTLAHKYTERSFSASRSMFLIAAGAAAGEALIIGGMASPILPTIGVAGKKLVDAVSVSRLSWRLGYAGTSLGLGVAGYSVPKLVSDVANVAIKAGLNASGEVKYPIIDLRSLFFVLGQIGVKIEYGTQRVLEYLGRGNQACYVPQEGRFGTLFLQGSPRRIDVVHELIHIEQHWENNFVVPLSRKAWEIAANNRLLKLMGRYLTNEEAFFVRRHLDEWMTGLQR